MRTLSIIFFAFLCLFLGRDSYTQTPGASQFKYNVWIYPKDNDSLVFRKGFLTGIQDSSILFLHAFRGQLTAMEYPISNIEVIKIRRKNQEWVSALIGGAIGFTFGYLLGYSSGDDECEPGFLGIGCLFALSKEVKAVLGGTMLGTAGMSVGAISGSVKIHIPISGSQQKFKNQRKTLEEYLE